MRSSALALLAFAACHPAELDCDEPGIVCTVAGTGQLGFNGEDKRAADTWLFFPSALQWDSAGRLLVDDFNNMLIRALEPDGTLGTVAGTNEHAYAIEGPATASPFENPFDIAADPAGGFYVAELHAARILRIDAAGMLTVFAGTGKPGYAGDGGPATDALLSEAAGVALHDDGRVFIADTDNGVIRVVEIDGTIGTLGDDGVGKAALGSDFASPQHLRVFGDTLFVADREHHQIRAIDLSTETATVIAGTGELGFSGDGGPATDAMLARPNGMTIGPDGSLYIADSQNDVVRRVDANGTLETVLGVGGEAGFSDLPTAIEDARLAYPADVLFSPEGRLYVADLQNAAVRAVWLD